MYVDYRPKYHVQVGPLSVRLLMMTTSAHLLLRGVPPLSPPLSSPCCAGVHRTTPMIIQCATIDTCWPERCASREHCHWSLRDVVASMIHGLNNTAVSAMIQHGQRIH